MNERDEPMKGLAEFLRTPASERIEDRLQMPRWAAEVEASRQRSAVGAQPIDMLLFCPKCGTQHIDAPEDQDCWQAATQPGFRKPGAWTNPPHKSHLCQYCKTIWRPADVPTNGVACGIIRGKADTWLVGDGAAPSERPAAPAQAEPDPMEDFEVNEITDSVNGQLQDYSRLAPAQAGVTDAMKTAIEAMEDSLEDAQIAQGEYDGRTYNFCTSCGADDLQTPVIGKHNPRCAWTKVRAAVAALKSALLAGTPPAQSDAGVQNDQGVSRVPHLMRQSSELEPNERATENRDRRAGEEESGGHGLSRGNATCTSGAELGARGGNAAQHEVAKSQPGTSPPAVSDGVRENGNG